MNEPVSFIQQQEAFNHYCQGLQKVSAFALDTEFMRERHFYAKAGLFQLNDGSHIALVDPLAIQDWTLLKNVLADNTIVKVLHACEEDIELCVDFLQVQPQCVFDTQIAAAMAGYDYSLSYQALVKQLLNIDIEKTQRRTDWLQRPLSVEQIQYAADDVRYLLPIYQQLQSRLQHNNNSVLLEAYYAETLQSITQTHYDDAYLRIKDAWRLNAAQFARVKALAVWREQTMRTRDWPRYHVATNDALIALAKQQTWHTNALYQVDGLPASIIRTDANRILEILDAVDAQGPYNERMPKPHKGKCVNTVKQSLIQLAHQQGIHEKLLFKKHYSDLLCQYLNTQQSELPRSITGWRKPFYQQAFQQLVAKQQEIQ